MKVIKGFKFLTSQQFAEPNSCFSLIWGKMSADRRLVSNPLEGYSCPSLPKLSRYIVTTRSCFLTEFLPVAFNPQGRSFWYKLMCSVYPKRVYMISNFLPLEIFIQRTLNRKFCLWKLFISGKFNCTSILQNTCRQTLLYKIFPY